MHKIKQQGRRWLSGLLALIMTVGLIPATGLVTPASAAGGAPPDKVYIEKADYDNAGAFEDPNLPSSNTNYNHSAWMRVFYMDMGDDYPTLPGFCANHDLNITTRPHAKAWVNGESITTAQGGKYMPAYNIIRAYVAGYLCSAYIEEHCGLTQGNYKSKYPDAKNLEDAMCQWAHENGYGYYAYQSPWTLQLGSAYAQSASWQCGAGVFTNPNDEGQLAKVAETYLRAHRHMWHPAPENEMTPENIALQVSYLKRTVAGDIDPYLQEFWDQVTDLYIYYPESGKDQPLIVPIMEPRAGDISAWLKVQKVDQDGKPLAGAKFSVYTSESCTGRPVATFETDANGYGAKEVFWQGPSQTKTFWVKETQAPPGFRGTTGSYEAPLNANIHKDEASAYLVRGGPWKNTTGDNDTPDIIKKVDENGIGIGPGTFHFSCIEAGEEFDVDFNESGNLTRKLQWLDPAQPNYIPEGTYQVTETKGPAGYVIDTEAKEIRLWTEMVDDVKTAMHSGPLTFVNHEEPKIIIEKKDESGNGLAGAKFDVYYRDALLTSFETGADGSYTLTGEGGGGLPDGQYTIVETEAPPGYMLPYQTEHKVFIQADDGGPKSRVITAINYRYSDIVLRKVQTGTTRGLAGASFEVKVDEQSIGTFGPTDGSGVIPIDYSTFGKYLTAGKDSWVISVREVIAPDGYMIDDTSWHSQVLRQGETLKEFLFEDEAPTTLIIKKVAANTDEPLAGATFEVEVEGEIIGTFGPTKEDGTITIPYERYGRFFRDQTRDQWTVRVREITPPAGYLISDKTWHTEVIHRGEKVKQFVFEDAKYPEILIAKKDKETGAYLPNATFDIKIDGTDFQSQKTTNEDGIIRITYDEYGEFLPDIDKSGKEWTVTVTEIKAPDGYNKDKQGSGDYTQTQSLKFDQSVTEFIFEDTSYRNIKVRKIDSKTGWPLMGAEFRLSSVTLDEGGSYDETQTTDASGYAYFKNVPNGTYNLTETQPPFGYDPDVYWTDGKPATRTVIVTSGDPVWVDFEAQNAPLPGLRIRKVDSVTQQPIKDALFQIEPLAPLQGSIIERTTDGNGEIVLQDLPTGSYRITEISVPKPYIVNSTPQIVAIDNQHDDYTVTFTNNAEGILYILKRDAETDEPLAGAWFSITKADGTAVADVGPTGPNGYVSLPGLQPGSYVVKETRAPDGHDIDGESKTFEVKAEDSGKVYVLIFDNHSKPEMWLRKVDANTGVGLEGAIFRIERGNGQIVHQNAISDREGFIRISNLEPGTYFAVETKAPSGYTLDPTPHPIVLEYGKTEIILIKNEQPGGIAIRKVDAATGAPLAGAKFQLYAIDDTPIGLPKTSGSDGYVRWSDLDPGFYTVREVEVPEGYVLDEVPVKLEVKEFQTVEHVWKNTQITTITVVKRDSDTLVPLAGATFGVYNMDGGLVDTLVTDLNGVATSKQLPLGWYKVVETKAPIGYVLNTEEHMVEVKANVPARIEVTNKPDKGLIIHKYDAVTKDVLPGAWFELQKLDGTVVLAEFSTDSSGTVTTTAVEPGEYYLVETKAPTGYVLSTEKILVTVKEGEATVVNVDNMPESVIEVFKTDSVTGDPLGGAEFEVADSTGKVLEYITTDVNGRAYTQVLKPGEYLVKETKAPAGYSKDETQHRVTVKEGENALLQVKNVPDTSIHITKIGASSKAPIAGAVFELYETCGIEPCIKVGQYTTDEYGQAVTEPLAPGIYKLKEIIAPAGYVLDETEYEVCVKAGEYNNIVIENQEAATLTVRKIDSKTGKPIAGAVFKLETASNKLIGMLESDANGEAIFTGLTAGHYIVTETQAPPGYSLSSPDSQNITVKYGIDNYCDFVDAANGSLVIILQDKHTGAYLPGGQFIVIRESDQKVIYDGSTDVSGTIVVGDLRPGWYIVKQAYAPDGYTMIDVELKVEILVGTQQTIYFKDETAGLTIEKVDAKNPHQTLEGARFQVIRETDGNVMGEYVTDKSGLALVNGLAPGRYTIKELAAPEGYIKMDEPKTVEVKGGANTHVTFPNMPRTSITVNVIDQATRVGVSGCIVEVWKQNGSLVNSYTSDSTGVIETQKLDNGFYVLKLVKVADGYSAVINEATVEVKDASEVTFTFELISNGVLKVMSTNNAGGAIAGMRFTLTTAEGKRIGSFTTAANGTYTFASLAPGYYTVTEDKAPEGFTINAETKSQQIEVKAGGVATVTFVHTQTFGLQIRTTCQQTGAPVAGVKYQITQLSGELVGVYTSDASGIAFAPLAPGWYLVTAIEAPAGYTLVETAPRTIQVLGDKMTTADFVVSQQSSLRVKVVDGSSGAPIYGVHLLLKNGTTNIQEYTTNSEGYITLNQTIVAGGYVLQMISAPSGYIVDTVPKSIDVLNSQTTEIVWKLYKDAGQIQVYVTSADYNESLDLPAGTPLQGAVFEIMNADTYIVVGQMISDTSGIAASAGLPIGRYTVKMVTAPAYYGINTGFNPEVRLKVNNDVVRVETSVQSVFLDTSISQRTNTSVTAGSTMRVDILTADNISDSRLDNFFIHLKVPTDVARITTLEPGTWDGDIWYKITYKTNMQDYRILAPDLLSSTKYTFDLSTQSLGLMPGEYVTDVRFEFGTVPSTFRLLEKTVYSLYVLSTAPTGYKLINDIEMGGQHNATTVSTNGNVNISGSINNPITGTSGQPVISGNSGQWVTDISSWSTAIIGKNPGGSLPKTGY